MSKRIVIINGHPDPSPDRYCHALATAYRSGAEAAGHQVQTLQIATMDIPFLRSATEFASAEVPDDIAAAQTAIRAAEHIIIIYPLWLGTMPALLKAFLEQTMRPGFAFEAAPETTQGGTTQGETSRGWPKALLSGRSARVVVTMGMPALVYRWYFGAHSLKSLERNVLKFVGISPIRESVISMVEAMSGEKRKRWLSKFEALGRQAA